MAEGRKQEKKGGEEIRGEEVFTLRGEATGAFRTRMFHELTYVL